MMRIGCFALVQPFTGMAEQFRLIRESGVENADLTDNHDGATLGVEYGFAASVSLDSHPDKIRRMAETAGVRLSAFCAHANLLDPPAPDVYATNQIIKAIRLAALLGIRQVITTDGSEDRFRPLAHPRTAHLRHSGAALRTGPMGGRIGRGVALGDARSRDR